MLNPDIGQNIKAFVLDTTESIKLKILDQTLLPKRLEFVDIHSTQDGYRVIKDMLVRGAPCIAAVGCLSMIVELNKSTLKTTGELLEWLDAKAKLLIESRPTAVNLKQALDKLLAYAKNNFDEMGRDDTSEQVDRLTKFCLDAIEVGEQANRRLGQFGADELLAASNKSGDKLTVLTHCNTGALATVGHGTALGVIRSLYEQDKLQRAYCTETRPYNQGSRLTAWELVQENIPATLIADNMVAFLMATKQIDAVLVGADRVAANGDTANKIGTLQAAVVARHYGVPFYVAAPTQSIDLNTWNGNSMTIEFRPADELKFTGGAQLAPDDIDVWNPCFDVTPADLITGIITEHGCCKPAELVKFLETIPSDDKAEALF